MKEIAWKEIAWKEEDILFFLKILPVVIAIFLFLLVIKLFSYRPEKILLKTYEEFSGMLKQKENSWYQRMERRLEKNGAVFYYGEWINPFRYLIIKILLAFGGMLVINNISIAYGLLSGILLFFVPDILLGYLNKQDNERLLPEIKLVYHALEIQIKAGVYVTDALTECYGSVQEKRFRKALLDLAGDIVMKADIYDAMERFQRKFDNRYIDALCITVLQALESGQAVELLNDISEQIKDMEAMVLSRKKSALDRSITFYQLGVLAAVLGVVLYACILHMYQAAAGF